MHQSGEQTTRPRGRHTEDRRPHPGILGIALRGCDQQPVHFRVLPFACRQQRRKTNSRLVGRRQRDDLTPDRSVRPEKTRCEPERILDHAGRGIAERAQNMFRLQGLQAFQRPQGVQSTLWDAAVAQPGRNRRHHGAVAGFHEQSLGGVTLPAVGVIEQGHPTVGLGRYRRRSPRRRLILAHDAIDPAAVRTRAHVIGRHVVVGKEARPVQETSIHVDDVERPIGTGMRVHGPEPFVRAREELTPRRRPPRAKAGT